jgi:hypothetical protein
VKAHEYETLFLRDFGEIFAELHSNFANLQPSDGQDLMGGLEVKVQLGPGGNKV